MSVTTHTTVYLAVLGGTQQPVRKADPGRRWFFDSDRGTLLVAAPHAPRSRKTPPDLGWLGITRSPLSERFPHTPEGDSRLLAALKAFNLPRLREDYRGAEADVPGLTSLLCEEDLCLYLVQDETPLFPERRPAQDQSFSAA